MEFIMQIATGVILLAAGYYLGQRTQRKDKQMDVLVRFLSLRRSSEDEEDTHDALACRYLICGYANVTTIQAIAEFERIGGVVETSQQKQSFARMINCVRKDLGLAPVETADLLAVTLYDV
jgi:hypothetical protein